MCVTHQIVRVLTAEIFSLYAIVGAFAYFKAHYLNYYAHNRFKAQNKLYSGWFNENWQHDPFERLWCVCVCVSE